MYYLLKNILFYTFAQHWSECVFVATWVGERGVLYKKKGKKVK